MLDVVRLFYSCRKFLAASSKKQPNDQRDANQYKQPGEDLRRQPICRGCCNKQPQAAAQYDKWNRVNSWITFLRITRDRILRYHPKHQREHDKKRSKSSSYRPSFNDYNGNAQDNKKDGPDQTFRHKFTRGLLNRLCWAKNVLLPGTRSSIEQIQYKNRSIHRRRE